MALVARPQDKEKEQTLVALLSPHRPPEPISGPVRLDVTFVFAISEGWPAWKRAAALAGRFYPAGRPDRGNCLKLVEDALERATFLVDDARIVGGEVAKRYGVVPGYEIRLTPLVQATRESEKVLTEVGRAI